MFCCPVTSKAIFLVISVISLSLGLLSLGWPDRSIRLYQRMMEAFNWRVHPIDEARELKNTKRFGIWLILLGVALGVVTLLKF